MKNVLKVLKTIKSNFNCKNEKIKIKNKEFYYVKDEEWVTIR